MYKQLRLKTYKKKMYFTVVRSSDVKIGVDHEERDDEEKEVPMVINRC